MAAGFKAFWIFDVRSKVVMKAVEYPRRIAWRHV